LDDSRVISRNLNWGGVLTNVWWCSLNKLEAQNYIKHLFKTLKSRKNEGGCRLPTGAGFYPPREDVEISLDDSIFGLGLGKIQWND